MNRWHGFGRTWVVVGRDLQEDKWMWVLVDEEHGSSVVFATEQGEDMMVSLEHRKIYERFIRLENSPT